jgi:hypothetical protein
MSLRATPKPSIAPLALKPDVMKTQKRQEQIAFAIGLRQKEKLLALHNRVDTTPDLMVLRGVKNVAKSG